MDDIATMTLDQTRAAAQELLDSTTGDLAGADAERFQALSQRAEADPRAGAPAHDRCA